MDVTITIDLGMWIAIAILAFLATTALGYFLAQWQFHKNTERKPLTTKDITEVAIFVALAFIIEVLVSWVPRQPMGGSITISLVPLIVLAYRKGFIITLYAGIIFGILNWMLAGFAIYVHWMEGPLDYILASGAVSLSALVFRKYRESAKYFAIAAIVGGFGRYFMHFLSGIIFFREFAAEGRHWLIHSIIYNGTYMIPTIILVSILSWALYTKMHDVLEQDLI